MVRQDYTKKNKVLMQPTTGKVVISDPEHAGELVQQKGPGVSRIHKKKKKSEARCVLTARAVPY